MTSVSPASPRSRTLLRLYYFTSFAAMGSYLPFFPAWLQARGLYGLRMSAVMACLPAMTVIAPPVFGFVADLLSLRSSLLQIASIGAWLAFSALGAYGLTHGSMGFATIFLAALVFSFFRAAMASLSDVLALEASGGQRSGYGRLRLFGSLGFAVSAYACGMLFKPTGLVTVPLCIAVGMTPAVLAAFALPSTARRTRSAVRGGTVTSGPSESIVDPPSKARPSDEPDPRHSIRQDLERLLRTRNVQLFLGATFFGFAGHICYDLCWSLHLQALGAADGIIGLSWTLGTAAEILLMAFAAPLFARFSPAQLLTFSLAGAAARWLIIGTVSSVPVLISLQFMHALSFGLMWISSLAYLEQSCPKSIRATAQGIFSATYGTGQVLGMMVWGVVQQRVGAATAFREASILAFAAFLLMARAVYSRARSTAPTEAVTSEGTADASVIEA